jgi:adenylate kinase
MRLILLGPPGGGKGTQAKLIEERLSIAHISTGDLLRQAVADRTELGRTAKEFMDRGELVPDELVIGMIEERVRNADCGRGFLFDGFPRNVAQAEALGQMLKRQGLTLDHVVSLDVPQEELLKRLTGRRTCRQCGSMCHVIFDPPREEGVCNRCGGELYQRDDDREETIRARLRVYRNQTAPLLDYYRSRRLLREVDGLGGTRQVFERIMNHVRSDA